MLTNTYHGKYNELQEKIEMKFSEFNFSIVFVKECIISQDQQYIGIRLKVSICGDQEKIYYFQVWKFDGLQCINSYKMNIDASMPQFRYCFSDDSDYFVNFNCNSSITIVYLKSLKENYEKKVYPCTPTEKLTINKKTLFMAKLNLLLLFNLETGEQLISFDFKNSFENFLLLTEQHFFIQENQTLKIKLNSIKKNYIMNKQNIQCQNLYDELYHVKKSQLLLAKTNKNLQIFSLQKLITLIRTIKIDYSFNTILIDKQISILETYRSQCPFIQFTNCLPQVNEIQISRPIGVNFSFENMVFFPNIILGWSWADDNPNNISLTIYKFKE